MRFPSSNLPRIDWQDAKWVLGKKFLRHVYKMFDKMQTQFYGLQWLHNTHKMIFKNSFIVYNECIIHT